MDLLNLTIYHRDLHHANRTNKQIASFQKILRHVKPSKSFYDVWTILSKRSEISGAMLGSPARLKCSTTIWGHRSVDNAVSTRLHFILEHLNSSGTYAHILFADFGLALTSITPSILKTIVQSILNAIIPGRQTLRAHQWKHLHQQAPEVTYLWNLQSLQMTRSSAWFRTTLHTNWLPGQNHWSGIFSKTVVISGFQDEPAHPTVSSRYSFKFRGTTIYRDLRWTSHIDSVRKTAQQRLNCLSQLGKFNLTRELLVIFYTATIQSTLLLLSGVDWTLNITGTDCNGPRSLQRRSLGLNWPRPSRTFTSPESWNARSQPSLQTPQVSQN